MNQHRSEIVSTYKAQGGAWVDCCDDCKKAGQANGTIFLGVADIFDECDFCDARNLPTREQLIQGHA